MPSETVSSNDFDMIKAAGRSGRSWGASRSGSGAVCRYITDTVRETMRALDSSRALWVDLEFAAYRPEYYNIQR
ncbi:MAG: hypothetical protein ACLU80_08805 [Dorea sp.]